MKIKCVITDDEPMARQGLEGYVKRIDFLQLEGICEDAVSLSNFLGKHPVDLLFLDIEMPYISGIELLQSLSRPPKVIFTTAYEKYAIKGYDFDVIDYLLKPISFDRFLRATNKAADQFRKETDQRTSDDFFVKTDGRLQRLSWKEILYIESMENYVCMHTANGKHIVHLTLKNVLEQMPVSFIQVHKSAIVNMSAITGITGNVIELGTHQIAIARALKEQVLEKILQQKLLKR